jgi:hypothetical protein
MLSQIDRHDLVDVERLGRSRATWGRVPVGAVVGKGFFSAANVLWPCTCANFARSIENDKDWRAACALAEEEASGLPWAGHGGTSPLEPGRRFEAANKALMWAAVHQYLPPTNSISMLWRLNSFPNVFPVIRPWKKSSTASRNM